MVQPGVAFIMEQTLGSITHYVNLRREESAAGDLPVRWVPVEYREGRMPWAVTGIVLARRAVRATAHSLRGAFVHTTTIALLLGKLLRRVPTILSTDGTPLN